MWLTSYEYTKILSSLATKIAASNDIAIKGYVEKYNTYDPVEIAKNIIREGHCRFGILKTLQNGGKIKIPINELRFPKIIEEPFDNRFKPIDIKALNIRNYPFHPRYRFDWNVILIDYDTILCSFTEKSIYDKSIIEEFIKGTKLYNFVCSILELYMTDTERLELLCRCKDRTSIDRELLPLSSISNIFTSFKKEYSNTFPIDLNILKYRGREFLIYFVVYSILIKFNLVRTVTMTNDADLERICMDVKNRIYI